MKLTLALVSLVLSGVAAPAQTATPVSTTPTPAPAASPSVSRKPPPFSSDVRLADTWMRDASILPDAATQTYTLVASGFGGVRAYTSKDLITWEGPHMVWLTPESFWPDTDMRSVWAPELHRYKDKHYLFLTFDTATKTSEQWRNWLPRVKRGSQVLVSDSGPLGPFRAFENAPTLPIDMMTLDGTLWIEDGVPYMVYCHEWVQIVNGTIEMIQLKDDLSATIGEPKHLFWGNDGPWTKRSDQYGCWVTDGPSLHRSKSGKLFMIWSSGSPTGYAVGVAISDSGKIAGPWRQQAEALFADDGGHGFLFHRFDGQLMMALHSPNDRNARIRLFELEDTGETLRIIRPFPAP